MLNLLGLGKPNKKGIRITIEYCPKNITLPYKLKKLINESSLKVPTTNFNEKADPFGFSETTIRVGEFLNEKQVEHIVKKARSNQDDFESVEIVEGRNISASEELLLD
tara:strand:+ start:259 stop:582 length:324 start_codon:yes stop_codon:yes gene_type:complete